MLFRSLLLILALVAGLLSGCSNRGVKVIAAVYGSGNSYADVSQRVADLMAHTSGFEAAPRWLGADPTPGWNKTLVIVSEARGKRHVFATGEGGRVNAAVLLEAARQEILN